MIKSRIFRAKKQQSRSNLATKKFEIFGRRIPVSLVLISVLIAGFSLVWAISVFAKPNAVTINLLSEDTQVTGKLGVSADNNGISSPQQIAQKKLYSQLPLSNRPNIIMVITDDQSYNQLGLAGNSVLKTPNINSLAKPGAYFRNAYVPEGICSPSRASIWTSKLPHIHGVTAAGMILPPDQITLPEILKANGYNTGFVGKCHLGDPNAVEEYTRGFDFRLINKLTNGYVPDWYNYQVTRNGSLETHHEYVNDFLTNEAIQYIQNQANDFKDNHKPFFLWLAPPSPHWPSIPPKDSNRYSASQMQLPPSVDDDLSTKPPLQSAAGFHQNYLELGQSGMKDKLKDIYEIMANTDDNIGRLNQTLVQQGLKNDTIVVYLSDNGIMLGEHQLYQKGPYFYNEQVKTPLIFSYPRLIQSAENIDSVTSTMDIMPTLLDILKVANPPNIQGRSFLANMLAPQNYPVSDQHSVYLEDPDQKGCMTYPMNGLIMDGFKWVHYRQGKYDPVGCASGNNTNGTSYDGFDFELYNLNKDPYEMNNLMSRRGPNDNSLERLLQDPTYGKVVQQIRKENAIWSTDTQGPARFDLKNGKVSALSPTALQVIWTIANGHPTAEIEYQEKNCALSLLQTQCPVYQLNDFSHSARPYVYTLSNLKPRTTYKIRVFSIGARGDGGYIDLEGTTNS